MHFTKAQMLKYLSENMTEINILPFFIVQSERYFENSKLILSEICSRFKGCMLIVRSSSSTEDTEYESNAGKFKSILNVKANEQALSSAIEAVYKSYKTKRNEEILIQPMLQNVIRSGVVFTADMDNMADYYTVNYQDGDNTAAVTGGQTGQLETFIAYKLKPDNIQIKDKDIEVLLNTCSKIEKFLNNRALDIEFAVDAMNNIYILQVRPITCKENDTIENLEEPLKRIYKKVQKLSREHPFLLGETTCFGIMPDWNPAEILGSRPKKLAISLYKELVTDSIWAHQRNNYGYRNLTLHPLMVSFCGIPYIDTRVTFNSFIPKELNIKISEKLVNYYLRRLKEYPVYHDKIEFEIVYSCYYLGISERLKKLKKFGFNENEIKRIEFSLLNLTNKIIMPDTGLYKKDIEKINILEQNYKRIIESGLSLVDKIYWLIEECKTYGTLPFAGAARAGFIAVQFLNSFVDTGIITSEEFDRFMNSLDTVNKQLSRDLAHYWSGEKTKSEIIEKYGHIRPGTYDILSPRYDEDFELYFSESRHISKTSYSVNEKEIFSQEIKNRLQDELEQNGLLVSADEMLIFIKEAIEGREYLKFVFTKSVSKILQLVEQLGQRTGIGKEELAYLDISCVKQLYTDLYSGNITNILKSNIESNKTQYLCAKQIKLPAIITEPESVYDFYLLKEEPNFITQKKIAAEIIRYGEELENPEGKIIFVQSADPGYDYLFARQIGGLITQFGGANSHMAIRCAELGIPAVIGAGEKNFTVWQQAYKLEIDCLKKQVTRLDAWREGVKL